MKIIRQIIAFLCLSLTFCIANAGNYSLKKGSTLKINCTATAPSGGWITHAFFSLVNSDDKEYLGIEYSSSDLSATLYGLKAKSNIKVEVTYAYSYKGTYDGDIHVGHGSYYDYISVTGAANATSVEFKEGKEIRLKPGSSVAIHAELYPAGSDAYLTWGFISGLGHPEYFSIKVADDGLSASVSAKREGSTYLITMIDGDQKKCAVTKLICSSDAEMTEPTSITLSPAELTLMSGEVGMVEARFTPSLAFAELQWSSSDEKVATVDEDGNVTAISAGKAIIRAKVKDTKLMAECNVTVKEQFASFSLPSSAYVNIGFTYTVVPVITPYGASSDLSWSSSDTSVATVSSGGIITAKSEGQCVITARSRLLGQSEQMTLTVSRPSVPLMDHRNLRQRVRAVKSLMERTLISDKL